MFIIYKYITFLNVRVYFMHFIVEEFIWVR